MASRFRRDKGHQDLPFRELEKTETHHQAAQASPKTTKGHKAGHHTQLCTTTRQDSLKNRQFDDREGMAPHPQAQTTPTHRGQKPKTPPFDNIQPWYAWA